MIITNVLKMRFLKDNSISMNIVQDEVFFDRLKLFDKLSLWEEFLKEISEFENEQAYFDYYNTVKDNVIEYIKQSEKYLEFNNMVMEGKKNNHTRNFYKEENVGKKCISIDINKANFFVLKKYGVLSEDTYEELIKNFTDKKHIINSKYIRQVIFGNTNPKRQCLCAFNYMCTLLETYFNDYEVLSINNDEIIFTYDEKIIDIFNSLEDKIHLKLNVFTLGKISGTKGYYKSHESGKITVHCVSGFESPFVYRKLKNEEPTELDRKIWYEGYVATLDENIVVEFLQ